MAETNAERLGVAWAPVSLGYLRIAVTHHGVCYLGLASDLSALEIDLAATFPTGAQVAASPAGHRWLAMARLLVESPQPGRETPPLDLRGTAFQRAVWKAMQQIPMGQTRSYGALARTIGRPRASRAVAAACSANPVGIIVPCHRVIRADGGLGGYYWGGAIKRALLAREGAMPSQSGDTDSCCNDSGGGSW